MGFNLSVGETYGIPYQGLRSGYAQLPIKNNEELLFTSYSDNSIQAHELADLDIDLDDIDVDGAKSSDSGEITLPKDVNKNSALANALKAKGSTNGLIARYDPGKDGIGKYYQLDDKAYTPQGDLIRDTSNLYGFKDKDTSNKSTLPSGVKENSALGKLLKSAGNLDGLETHYDPGKYGIGKYYKYNNKAYTPQGDLIRDTSRLYGFDD